MKALPLFLLLTCSTSALAEVFTWTNEPGKKVSVQITKFEGVLVNEECAQNKVTCQKLISSARKQKAPRPKEKGPLGNPASQNCSFHQGQSEILRDEKHNDYDFCLFEGKYLIDSWALMK